MRCLTLNEADLAYAREVRGAKSQVWSGFMDSSERSRQARLSTC
jgi:hypothetical protein